MRNLKGSRNGFDHLIESAEDTIEDLIRAADEAAEAELVRIVLMGIDAEGPNEEATNLEHASERVAQLAERALQRFVEQCEIVPAHVTAALTETRLSTASEQNEEIFQGATKCEPVDSRQVVRCNRCHLIQFLKPSNQCRRCSGKFNETVTPDPAQVEAISSRVNGKFNFAANVRALRMRMGLSQRQLALRMNVPRTYVGKLENERATPTLSSMERLARALEVTVPELLDAGERIRHEEILRCLLNEPFVIEMLPYLSRLDDIQLHGVLNQVRELRQRSYSVV